MKDAIINHDAKAVANVFYKLAKSEGKPLTNMQLQKLVYIAHGFNLAVLGDALFEDEVRAWDYGPVIPPLYNELKQYGAGEVKDSLMTRTPPIKNDSPEMKVIRAVWSAYGKYSGKELSAMTHKRGTPWYQAYEPGKRNVIPDKTIKEYYLRLLNEQTEDSNEIG